MLFLCSCLDQSYTGQEGDKENRGVFEERSKEGLRFVHLEVGAPPYDIYERGDERLVSRLNFGENTTDISFDRANLSLSVRNSDTKSFVYETNSFLAGERNTFVFYRGFFATENMILTDPVFEPISGQANIRVAHLAYFFGRLDIFLNSEDSNCSRLEESIPSFSSVFFRGRTFYQSVEPGTYDICVAPEGETNPFLFIDDMTFNSNSSSTLFLVSERNDLRRLGIYRLSDLRTNSSEFRFQ